MAKRGNFGKPKTNYECPRCNHKTTDKRNMERHFFVRKKICKGTIELTEENKKIALIGFQEFFCDNCGSELKTQNALDKHTRTCKVAPVIIQNITNNIQNIQNNFTVNAYINTDTSKLTDEDYISVILDSGSKLNTIPRMIKRLHFNQEIPENQNIKAYPKGNTIYLKNEKNEWELNHPSVIEDIIQEKINLIKRWAILTEREAKAKTNQKRIDENDKSMDNVDDHETAIETFNEEEDNLTTEEKKERTEHVTKFIQQLTAEVEMLQKIKNR